ncbi:MAG: cyclic-di-AMP receptor [Limnochordaceae bacterium]|nr:cyclic-di-AMP receptor [Limnochordaceae bacterium]
MQLLLAIVDDDDAGALMDALSQKQIGATKLASTGGFLLQGNTTLLIGVEDARVPEVIQLIRKVSVRRRMVLPATPAEAIPHVSLPIEVETGGAIIFGLEVEAFYRI